MNRDRLIVAFLLIFLFLSITSCSFAIERDFDESNNLIWTTAKNIKYDEILGEDDNNIFIKSQEDIIKIKKDLSNGYEIIPEYEFLDEDKIKTYVNRNKTLYKTFKNIPEENVKYENHYIIIDGIKMVNMNSYEDSEDKWYEETGYEREPIRYSVRVCKLNENTKLYTIKINTCSHIPAPYTPVDFETYIVQNKNVKKLDFDSKFTPESVYEYNDKYLTSGSCRNWKSYISGKLYMVDKNNNVTYINEKIKSERLELLDIIDNKMYLKSYILKSGGYDPVDREYSNEIYAYDRNLNLKKIEGIKDIYKSDEGNVYTINKQENTIIELNKKNKKDLSEFKEEISMYNELEKQYNKKNLIGKYYKNDIENLNKKFDLTNYTVVGELSNYNKNKLKNIVFLKEAYNREKTNIKIFNIANPKNIKVKETNKKIKNYYTKSIDTSAIISPGEYYKLLSDGSVIFKEGLDRFTKLKNVELGDAIGEYKKTQNFYGVNGRKVPIYRIDDNEYICVEDLKYCGYEMTWDSNSRKTTFVENDESKSESKISIQNRISDKGDLFFSDIKILIDGKEIKSLNTNGYSLVSINDLEKIIKIKIR